MTRKTNFREVLDEQPNEIGSKELGRCVMTRIVQKLVRAAVVACLATMIVSRLSAAEYYVDSEIGSDQAGTVTHNMQSETAVL